MIYKVYKTTESHYCRQKRTNLINKNNAGLEFDGQREDGGGQLLWFPVPHVCQRRGLKVDEFAAWGFSCCLGDHSLPTAGRTVQ